LAAAAFLEAMLEDVWPEKEVQVFNLGITSLASFAVAQVLEDVLALEPDLATVYTGHNEFYGIYGAARFNRLHYTISQLRMTRLLRSLLDFFRSSEISSGDLIEILARRGEVQLNSPRRAVAEEHLRENPLQIARMCGRAQMPLILFALAANETGFAPRRVRGAPSGRRPPGAWRKWVVEEAAERLFQDPVVPEAALQGLKRASDLSSPDAWLWYLQGRTLVSLGEGSAARPPAFHKARDLDNMPWRAPRAHNEVIRAVERETDAGSRTWRRPLRWSLPRRVWAGN
jgi:hypothetical protein